MKQVEYDTIKEGEMFVTYYTHDRYKCYGLCTRKTGDLNTSYGLNDSRMNYKAQFCVSEERYGEHEVNFETIKDDVIYFLLDKDEIHSIIATNI